jgi:hypothetical protein
MGIWVDTSTSWGIGVMINGLWDAWKFYDGWSGPGRNIGWLEGVAVELACLILEARGAFERGRGRNFVVKFSICRTDVLMVDRNISISFIYVPSEVNLADPISRGELGLPSLQS